MFARAIHKLCKTAARLFGKQRRGGETKTPKKPQRKQYASRTCTFIKYAIDSIHIVRIVPVNFRRHVVFGCFLLQIEFDDFTS